jgi:hypothetical protein
MAKHKSVDLPGMVGDGVEEKRIKAIDDAADLYTDARDKRMTLGEQEVERREKLLDLMKKHGLKRYQYDGQMVEITDGLKVKKIKPPKD